MTLQDVVAQAQQIEGTGFPIDWKQMTMRVLSEATIRVTELEAQVKELTPKEKDDESDTGSAEGKPNGTERPSGAGSVRGTEEGEGAGASGD